MFRTTLSLGLAASALALGLLPSVADAATTANPLACPKGTARKAVTSDRFRLAGCLTDVKDARGTLLGYEARGTASLNGLTLTPQTSIARLALTRRRLVLGRIIPASVTSASTYSVAVEGDTLGSFRPDIRTVAAATTGARTAFARAAAADEGDGTYDCGFKPKDAAKFKGFELVSDIVASVLEVRCTITPTGVALGAGVKLPKQITPGAEVRADLDVAVDANTGLVQTASVGLMGTPLPLGPLVTEQILVRYDRTLNRWIGSADVHEGGTGALIFQGRLGHLHAALEIDVNPFRVRRLETDIVNPSLLIVGQGLGPALMLHRIGFRYTFNDTSFTLGGTIGLQGSINVPGSTLPMSVVAVDGDFQVQVPGTPSAPYVFRIGGEADFSQGWGSLAASLASGSSSITYSTDGRLSFHGSITGGFGQLPLVGDLAGATVTLDGLLTASAFSATGAGSVFVNVPFVGRFQQSAGNVQLTNKGFGFCVLGNAAFYTRTWAGAESVGVGCNLASIN